MKGLLAALVFSAAPAIFSNVFVTPKLLAACGILVILCRNKVNILLRTEILVFAVVAIVSAMMSVDVWASVVGNYRAPYYGLLAIFMISGIYMLSSGVDDVTQSLEILGSIAGLIAIFQIAFNSPGIPGISSLPGSRAIGLTGSPVFFGAILIPCFAASWEKNRSDYPSRWHILSIALIVSGIVAAKAKGAMLGCAGVVWAFDSRGKSRWAGIGFLALLTWMYMIAIPADNNRERLELARIAWASFCEYPWFGWGPDNFLLAFRQNRTMEYISILHSSIWGQASAHSDWGQVLPTMGAIGFAAYLWLLSSLVRATRSAFAASCLAGVWIQAQVNPVPIELMVILALILGRDHAE